MKKISFLMVIIVFWCNGIGFSLQAMSSDNSLLLSWKTLSWQEQAQCGTSVAKAMVDIIRSSSQQHALRPFLFWAVTLADDAVNLYNSWVKRGDQEYYSAFWLIRDLFYAAKELSEEPSVDDLDLFDDDEFAGEGDETTVDIKKAYPAISPLVKAGLSLYGILSNAPEDHKKRIILQGLKSLMRCGRWYFKSASNDKKSFETRVSMGLIALNVMYLCKDMVTDYPAHELPKKSDQPKPDQPKHDQAKKDTAEVGTMTDPKVIIQEREKAEPVLAEPEVVDEDSAPEEIQEIVQEEVRGVWTKKKARLLRKLLKERRKFKNKQKSEVLVNQSGDVGKDVLSLDKIKGVELPDVGSETDAAHERQLQDDKGNEKEGGLQPSSQPSLLRKMGKGAKSIISAPFRWVGLIS